MWRTRAATALAAAGALVMSGGLVMLSAPTATATSGDPHKVWVCHATSSDSNPYVAIHVDVASKKYEGHLQHRNTPNKFWKSAGTWNGIDHGVGTAQQPNKPDYIEGLDFPNADWTDGAPCKAPGVPEKDCVDSGEFTHTYNGTNAGTVTLTTQGDKPLCSPFYVRAAAWTYDGPNDWPQTTAGSNLYEIDGPGSYPYVAPTVTCGQYDIYAGWSEDEVDIPNNLVGPNNPFEPDFLHQHSSGPEPTYFMTGHKQCNQPPDESDSTTETRMSCQGGVESRTVTTTYDMVWNDKTGDWEREPIANATVTEGPWTFVRALSDAEKRRLQCIPDQPDPKTVVTPEERMSCESGVETRNKSVTTTYVWNDEAWEWQPVVGAPVYTDWVFSRDLSPEEIVELDCRPDQPEPDVANLDDDRMTCEEGVEAREGTQTTTYEWNAETRTYDPVVGEEVWGDWTFVRDLNADELADLQCVKGSESTRPKPDKKPTVLGTQAGVPTAVAAGVPGQSTASSTTSLLAQLMVAGGLLLLLAGGWLGFGRREHGVHQA